VLVSHLASSSPLQAHVAPGAPQLRLRTFETDEFMAVRWLESISAHQTATRLHVINGWLDGVGFPKDNPGAFGGNHGSKWD